MNLPFFYTELSGKAGETLVLDEPTSKHIVQVLRMENDENLQLTNGKGILMLVQITDNHRKRCTVQIKEVTFTPASQPQLTIAISILKNNSRFEWFLEKATEMGMNQIIPLVSERTERVAFKQERMQQILISALLQSQQVWLPKLVEPISFQQFIQQKFEEKKWIAHCLPDQQKQSFLTQLSASSNQSQLILIGPEGDFSATEIDRALAAGFSPVSLGNTRLRTETAGMVSAAWMTGVRASSLK